MLATTFPLALLLGTTHAGPLSSLNAVRRQTSGFSLAPDWKLEASNIDSTCKQVLQQTISCDDYVAELGKREYRSSLEDTVLTDSVCAATCNRSLTTSKRRISGACGKTPDLTPGVPVATLIESIISGWEETCLKDTESGGYCNDIIDSWGEFKSIEEMPKNQVCSYCFGAKLRMMQKSPYSAYDELFAEMLSYVNKRCNVKSPTEPINPNTGNDTMPETCDSSSIYITKTGDTCDTVALAKSVSAATLYYINPDLRDCSSIEAGVKLCLPKPCKTLYTAKENDDCVIVAINAGTSHMSLVDWNLSLDSQCTNIWGDSPSWGTVICVTPPGGEFEDKGAGTKRPNSGSGNLGGEGGSGDGYAKGVVAAPKGNVAKDTTKLCGEYIQANSSVGCASMLISTTNAVPIDLFLKANPSLKTAAECDSNLVAGTWYCLRPARGFDD
ncbi:hypothetical protein G7Z17_g5036 [Cylindrodendrum hubeiense]|uniref:LysM domain-containing protein n=1 Tax=Cylindrodendrum hubeiense TaxID=595255 RepID=A0A9P5LHQ7_9HYPO|nr:hypothetical protein G7Z17_g5036 [Cylindrodendrum hubeiense]